MAILLVQQKERESPSNGMSHSLRSYEKEKGHDVERIQANLNRLEKPVMKHTNDYINIRWAALVSVK